MKVISFFLRRPFTLLESPLSNPFSSCLLCFSIYLSQIRRSYPHIIFLLESSLSVDLSPTWLEFSLSLPKLALCFCSLNLQGLRVWPLKKSEILSCVQEKLTSSFILSEICHQNLLRKMPLMMAELLPKPTKNFKGLSL